MKFLPHVLVLLAIILSGCSTSATASVTPQPAETGTTTQTVLPTEPDPQAPTNSPTPGPVTLRIWVPPQFDPASGTLAGNILQARLDEFTKRRPGAHIEVRVKAEEGTSGLLDSLTSTHAAAPLVLPDLVALPRHVLEEAAGDGLLLPLDDLMDTTDNSDWYEYARQLSRVQDKTFGLPFAGDALLLVYRPGTIPGPPKNWLSTLESEMPLVFAAADPQALFTITQYLAIGGAIVDDQGQPFLDVDQLATVLGFYLEASQNETIPYWVTQYQDDEQVWEAYLEGTADMVVVSSSRYLGDLQTDTAIAPIPTADGSRYTLADGWAWALVTPPTDKLDLSIELAEYLTDSTFQARWTQASGYLPARPSAMEAWSNENLRSTLGTIVLSARLLPSADLLDSLGIPLQQATVEVLKEQSDPLLAAQAAWQALAEGLTGP